QAPVEVRLAALTVLVDEAPRDELARALAAAIDGEAPVVARALETMPLLAVRGAAAEEPIAVFADLTLAAGAPLERRLRAVEALGRTRSELASPRIESALREALPVTHDRLRVEALVALARTGGRAPGDVAPSLVDLLAAPATEVQDRAIE